MRGLGLLKKAARWTSPTPVWRSRPEWAATTGEQKHFCQQATTDRVFLALDTSRYVAL